MTLDSSASRVYPVSLGVEQRMVPSPACIVPMPRGTIRRRRAERRHDSALVTLKSGHDLALSYYSQAPLTAAELGRSSHRTRMGEGDAAWGGRAGMMMAMTPSQ